MSIAQGQSSSRRKRPRTEAELLDSPSELLPSKRRKLCIKLHSAEFYDSLSKVWLTPRALKELDRRRPAYRQPRKRILWPPVARSILPC
ncbi:hypothetical protein F5884DRAFT_809100 [Xylogone sp. PMI_703]|nr:hypothetical protein F5884DRAFT_809100 [Xylogone sp. PMI_703]